MGASTQQFDQALQNFQAAWNRWGRYVKATDLPAKSTETRYCFPIFGRWYYLAHQWVPADSCGYIYYGVVEDFGKPTERDVLKYTAVLTEDEKVEGEGGGFLLGSEADVKDFHFHCLMEMDKPVCAALPKCERVKR